MTWLSEGQHMHFIAFSGHLINNVFEALVNKTAPEKQNKNIFLQWFFLGEDQILCWGFGRQGWGSAFYIENKHIHLERGICTRKHSPQHTLRTWKSHPCSTGSGNCGVIMMNWLNCNYAGEGWEKTRQQFRWQFGRRLAWLLQLGPVLCSNW